MANLIERLEKEYDMLCLDSPPLVAVNDATLISKEIDQLILVTKSGGTDKNAFLRTLQALSNVDVPLVGVVLNGVTSKNSYGVITITTNTTTTMATVNITCQA